MVICTLSMTIVNSVALTGGDWESNESNKEATATGYTGTLTDKTIPSTLGSYSITVIGDNSLESKTAFTGITIPDTMLTIGADIFRDCKNLQTLAVGTSVTS